MAVTNALEQSTQSHADVLVAFGITGDLAKQMTFRSLDVLQERDLLQCPILGVAVDDWTVDHLREHARNSIAAAGETIDEHVFDRFAARLSYVQGDFADPASYERVKTALQGKVVPSSTSRSRRRYSGWS